MLRDEWYQTDAEVQLCIADLYHLGEGIEQSFEKAVKWYKLAADQGNADAQYNLGLMYLNGKGVTQSIEKAAEWFQKAADQGDVNAQLYLEFLDELKVSRKIKTDTLIRTAPNYLADVKRSIMSGNIVYTQGEISESNGSWIYIYTEDGTTGWIPESATEKITN